MNDDNIQMLISLIVLFVSINLTNGNTENTTNITSSNQSLPIEKLLHQQYDNRQLSLSGTTNHIRPWKTSNSIETLKKMIANRQRAAANSRALVSTSTIRMFYFLTYHSLK
jgi:hypothetical protein